MEANCPPNETGMNATLAPDAALVAAGWTQRFMTDPAHADDLVELYHRAGFEVTFHQPKPVDFDDRCGDCPAIVCKTYVMLYTRPRSR